VRRPPPPSGDQPGEASGIDERLIGQHEQHGARIRRQRGEAAAERPGEPAPPRGMVHDLDRAPRIRAREQRAHAKTLGADDDDDPTPGRRRGCFDGARDEGDAVPAHELLGSAEARGAARCEHDGGDLW